MANAKELLKIYSLITNELNSVDLKHPSTKKTYSIKPFLKLCSFHIPTAAEMSQMGNGKGLNKKYWKAHHFLATAQYYVDQAGFPSGKLPCHEEWCDYRQDACTVYVSVFGEVIKFHDPIYIQWYDQIVAFPQDMYNTLNNHVTTVLQKHFADPPAIDEEEPFGALMFFQRHVVWRLVLLCIRAYPQINKAIVELEARSIQSSDDVSKLEEEARLLLTFKEFSTSKAKFAHDHAFQQTVLAFIEAQETFRTETDRLRAADAVRKLQNMLENGITISRSAFFNSLHGIFRPNMGLTPGDAEVHLAVTAFSAKENYGTRGASRKENANPQFTKRKPAPTELTMEQKGYADLKSEFGQMRSDIYAIMNHLGIDKKRKSHDDVNKQGKAHAGLANAKISRNSTKARTATSFPRRYVDEEDSVASDSDDQGRVERAMFARIRTIPPPKLSIQSIYGQNSRTDFETSKSMWECDRIGNARPGPRFYEPGLTAASTLYDVPNYWEDDKASSASSKNSLTTRTQHMEISMDELRVKQPFFPPKRNQSPHAESLLADYRKHLEQYDSDCYIHEDDHAKLQGQSEEIVHEQEMEDDRPPEDVQDTMPETSRFGAYRTRRVTRMESYNYPTPVIPGGDDGAGPMADNMHFSPRVDKNDIASSIQEPMVTTSKHNKRSESATPRTTNLRAPRSGTPAPTDGSAFGNQYDLRTLRPPTATEVSAVWPPLSAPGATIYDQHDATSIPAATSLRNAGPADDDGDM